MDKDLPNGKKIQIHKSSEGQIEAKVHSLSVIGEVEANLRSVENKEHPEPMKEFADKANLHQTP